jgi:hypothetical protein
VNVVAVGGRTTTPGFGAGAKTLIGLAALAAIAFIVLAAFPYHWMLSSREAAEHALSPNQISYWPRRGWLLTHIAGGLVALLAGPVQLWLGLSDRRMDLHRKLGLLYIGGMTVGSIGAIGLAFKTDGGFVFGAGLFFLAVAWITTTAFAYVAIRKGLVDQHREWTIRSYVVTFAFVTFRLFQGVMQSAGIGTVQQEIDIMSWACWALPLLITEVVLQSRRIAAGR